MKKILPVFVLVVIYTIFLTSCKTQPPTAYPTYHPSAVEPMQTIFAWQTTCTAVQPTIASLGETATFLFQTKTPTNTPASTITPIPPATPRPSPNAEKIKKLLNGELCQAFGVERRVVSVKFEPEAGSTNAFENATVLIECKEEGSQFCASNLAFIDFINTCKDNNHKISDLFPDYTKNIQLQIIQPGSEIPIAIFDVNWADVKSYIAGGITSEVFETKIREFSLPAE